MKTPADRKGKEKSKMTFPWTKGGEYGSGDTLLWLLIWPSNPILLFGELCQNINNMKKRIFEDDISAEVETVGSMPKVFSNIWKSKLIKNKILLIL